MSEILTKIEGRYEICYPIRDVTNVEMVAFMSTPAMCNSIIFNIKMSFAFSCKHTHDISRTKSVHRKMTGKLSL
jgi:hypothetical protein